MPSSTPPLQQFSALGRSAKLFYCLEMAILLIKQHCCWHSIGLRGVSLLPDSNCPVYQPHFAPIPTLTASTDNTTHLVNRKSWALRLSVLSCWDSNPGIASCGLQVRRPKLSLPPTAGIRTQSRGIQTTTHQHRPDLSLPPTTI